MPFPILGSVLKKTGFPLGFTPCRSTVVSSVLCTANTCCATPACQYRRARRRERCSSNIDAVYRDSCGDPCDGMSERRACRVVQQPRGTQRYRPIQRDDEDTLTQAIVTWLASMAAMAIAGLRRCSDGQAGMSARTGWSESGVVRAEGSKETEAKRSVVAQRRVVRASAPPARQPCLEL